MDTKQQIEEKWHSLKDLLRQDGGLFAFSKKSSEKIKGFFLQKMSQIFKTKSHKPN